MKEAPEFRELGRGTLPPLPAVRRKIAVIRRTFGTPAGLDTAMSRALLLRVSAGEAPETLRLHVPGRIVAFGRQDVAADGYRAAVAAAATAGFTPIERLAGGRAAVFHEGTLAFAWSIPDPEPTRRTRARFAELAGIVATALAGLGVDARIGEVPGEYCPGEFSVSAGGRRKLMGVGQRLTRRAAHVGGVIVVSDPALANAALAPVYAALGLDWDPAVTGSVADEMPGATTEQVAAAVLTEFGRRHELVPAEVDAATVELAERLRPEHVAVGRAPARG